MKTVILSSNSIDDFRERLENEAGNDYTTHNIELTIVIDG
jgi:hypothetical protein